MTDPNDKKTDEPLSYTDEESDIENRTNQSHKAFDTGTQSSDLELTPQLFDDFKKTVFSSRPNIAHLYNQIGNIPFYTYAKSHTRENRNKLTRQRKPELASLLQKHIRKVLGSEIADSVVRQLKSNDSVSTVQHFSPLSHPDSLNSVLENSLPYFDATHPSFQNVLVFACAGVSFNNTKFPRGHLFHTYSNNALQTHQFSFFGHTADARPVIHHPPYTIEAIKDIKNSFLQLKRDGLLTEETITKIVPLLDEVYSSPHVLSFDNYIDQLTVSNYWLFKKLFSHYSKSTPNLVYLSQEKVVLELLTAYHLYSDTPIHQILFDPKIHALIDTHFEGVTGAFSKEKGLGTYLFWALPKNSKYRVQLWRDGDWLRTKDNSFSVQLTQDAIQKAINNNELIPSVMLTFCVLALYYGLILGGGYEQTYYLTQTKKSFITIFKEVGDNDTVASCEDLLTTNLVIPRPILMYLSAQNDMRIPATGLDMFLYGDSGKSWNKMLTSSKQVTVSEIIERTLPSIYREYCKNATNFELFSKLTERDIEKFTGLDKKIPAFATL